MYRILLACHEKAWVLEGRFHAIIRYVLHATLLIRLVCYVA